MLTIDLTQNSTREQAGRELLSEYHYQLGGSDSLEQDITLAVSDLLHYAAGQGFDIELLAQIALGKTLSERGL